MGYYIEHSEGIRKMRTRERSKIATKKGERYLWMPDKEKICRINKNQSYLLTIPNIFSLCV